jgi:hypothetical protein
MSFAIYGIAILVLIGAIIGGVAMHDHGIKAAQQAADQAAVTAAQSNTAICKQANVDLQTSVEAIEADRVKQNENVLAWKALAERAATVAQNNLNAAQSTLVQLSAAQKDARAKAGRPAQAMTCEQTLAEIDADSKQFAAQRAILFPTAAPDAVRVGK